MEAQRLRSTALKSTIYKRRNARVHCLWIETRMNASDPSVGLIRQPPIFPFTIGLKAISGWSAEPVPSVLFKLGAG